MSTNVAEGSDTGDGVREKGAWLTLRRYEQTIDLPWLVNALDRARSQDQVKLVDYLQTIADDVVFEMEVACRNGKHGWQAPLKESLQRQAPAGGGLELRQR